MPTWDYECNKCGAKFTISSKLMNDHQKNPECPECKSTDTEQTWDDGRAPNWQFK
ncbi:MAG: FmdB family zinc ribbon protein [Planctomycetota bacterium]|jgi:putative FmdB family regulatory protein